MSTVITPTPVASREVDVVLDELCRHLQITPSQYEQAESAYRGVTKWLMADGNPFSIHNPDLYPQGSMALRTSVRPARHQEFDLDIVCQVERWPGDPMGLYDAVGRRLREHGTYAPILKPMNRCWRLDYAGNFHLDVLPARPEIAKPGNAVEVPDRSLREWRPSNPKDYAKWFDTIARAQLVIEKRVDPLPDYEPATAAEPLRRAVQLMKRHRDIKFLGREDSAPRSIVLTTLAARYYRGQTSITDALLAVLSEIASEIQRTPGIMQVLNPMNPAENFADRWTKHPEEYEQFKVYITEFATDLRSALSKPLGAGFEKDAERIFGGPAMNEALVRYGKRIEEQRKAALRAVAISTPAPTRPWSH